MITFEKCVRLYRFYEALALYDCYYDKVASSFEREAPPVMDDDRPLTWVPLVFHCTTFDALEGILQDGSVRSPGGKEYVSLTELPVAELTRMRALGQRTQEVAIGFPRALLERRGLFQPAYLKHAPTAIKEQFKSLPSGYVELHDDLGALHEVRVPGTIPIDDAVWILSSERNDGSGDFDHPCLTQRKLNGISLSYWHPTHQEGMIREPIFHKIARDSNGRIIDVRCLGEHYYRTSFPEEIATRTHARANEESEEASIDTVEYLVELPSGRPQKLQFPSLSEKASTTQNGWHGPCTKIDVARIFYSELKISYPERMNDVFPRVMMS